MPERYQVTGIYSYHGSEMPFVGFITVEGEKVQGAFLDEAADVLTLAIEGTLQQQKDKYVLEVDRRALEGRFIQNTLSDPIKLKLTKKADGKINGAYEGTWEFKEECFNIRVGLDDHGEKTPTFARETQKSDKVRLTLDGIVASKENPQLQPR